MTTRTVAIDVLTGFLMLLSFTSAFAQNPDANIAYATYMHFVLPVKDSYFIDSYTISSNGSTNILGDVITQVKFCPLKSKWICVHGDVYKFAIPRRKLQVGDKWKFSGVTYELIPSYRWVIPGGRVPHSESPDWNVTLLNKDIKFHLIQTSEKRKGLQCINEYLFSDEHGLLSSMGYCNDRGTVFTWTEWLSGTDGLGSPLFEQKIPANAFLSKAEVTKLSQ